MATVKIIKSSAGFGFMRGAKYPMIIENVAIEDGMAKVTSRQLFEAGEIDIDGRIYGDNVK